MTYFNHKFTAYSIMMLFIKKNMTFLKSPASFHSACSKEKNSIYSTREALQIR